MIYECDKCGAALPPGVTACPKCGDPFEDAVPADAELPAKGFTSRPTAHAAPPSYVLLDRQAVPETAYSPQTAPVQTAPAQRRSPAGLIGSLVFVFVVAPLIVTGLYSSSRDPAQATSAPPAPTPPVPVSPDEPAGNDGASASAPGPELRVGSEHFGKEYDYDIVDGEVTNVSGRSLSNVEAVTTFYDGSGNVVKTEDALISYNPIQPGQTSPYKTMGTDNPLIKTERTAFQVMGGEELEATSAPAPDASPTGGSSSHKTSSESSSDEGRDPTRETGSAGSGLDDEPLSRQELTQTLLSTEDIGGKSLAALSISYNTIYAVHGYIFKRASLRRIFESKPWYHPDPSFKEKDLTTTGVGESEDDPRLRAQRVRVLTRTLME